MRGQELDIRASSSMPVSGERSTTDGAKIEVDGNSDGVILRDVGTTDGNPIIYHAGSVKLDTLAC